MSNIDTLALREAAEAIKVVATPQKLLAFRMKVTPQVVLALLDEIKRLEDTNIDAMCRIAELETNLAALSAESELARKAVQAFCDVVGDSTEVICEEIGRDGVLVILEAMKATGNMPATDAFLAEVRAQGVEMMREHPSIKLCSLTHICDELAAQLRKGGSQ